jgi:hypothetical protein
MAVSVIMDGVQATRDKRPQATVQHKLIPSLTIRASTQRPPRSAEV